MTAAARLTVPSAGAGPSPAGFASGERPKWCPGCGNHSVLVQLLRTLAESGRRPSDTVIVSGIGCSGRLPYYVGTFGFHALHGRAPALATGLKLARPDLAVWVVMGDGDAMSIGGNHLIHALRRNVDVKIILINNGIYGLTKGQASPTSKPGTVSRSSPFGSTEPAIDPLRMALAAGATFAARSLDSWPEHLRATLQRASKHRGAAFVEILENCRVFADGVWREFTAPDVREDRTIRLEDGRPLVFGRSRDRGIRLRGLRPEVASLAGPDATADLLIHDEAADQPTLALLLTQLVRTDFPVPLGVFRVVTAPVHHESLPGRSWATISASDRAGLQAVLDGPRSWTRTA